MTRHCEAALEDVLDEIVEDLVSITLPWWPVYLKALTRHLRGSGWPAVAELNAVYFGGRHVEVFDDTSLAKLVDGIEGSASITEVFIMDNQVTDASVDLLRSLPKQMAQLTTLVVGPHRMTHNGLQRLHALVANAHPRLQFAVAAAGAKSPKDNWQMTPEYFEFGLNGFEI